VVSRTLKRYEYLAHSYLRKDIFGHFLNYFLILAALTAYGSFQARDQTQATAMTKATAVTMPDRLPTEPPRNSSLVIF